jgi:hypothetical protein
MKHGALLLVVGLVAGCSSDPGPVAFAADPPSDGATVFLRGAPEGDRVVVEVVARGAPEVHGSALRVTWNPGELTHVETKQGLAWSKSAFFLAKEGTPGQLAISWTERGPSASIDATNETVLGTMVFHVKGRGGSAIAFKTERSALVDMTGKTIPVTFRNGAVPAR